MGFHLALEGRGEPPFAWLVSRLCEEFSISPGQALRELAETPWRLLSDILELRAYARAKELLEQARSEGDVPRTPAVEMVWEVQAELLRRRRQREREGQADDVS